MKQLTIAILMITIITTIANAQKKITSWNKNQVIAHRGAWKKNNIPENSIAALQQAFKLNCHGSEFDVHLTLDSIIVVNHDATFLGTSIAKSTYKQLLEKKLSNGETIPTLENYLKTGMKQKKTKLILEIKPQNLGKERDMLLTEKALQMVRKLKAQAWVEYISFGYDICTYIIKNEPNAKVAYLTGNVEPEKMKADGFSGVDYHFSVYQQNADYITRFKKLGMTVNGWTANLPAEISYLIANEVEYITTNEPELTFEMIKNAPLVSGWKLKWADEFGGKGLPDPKNWTYDVGGNGWGNNEKQFYTKADTLNTKVEKGSLNITVRKTDKENMAYTSARLATRKKFDWKYGRLEVRAMLPKGRGLWPAIWMLPTNWKYGSWPASGEIDVMEHVGFAPDSIHGTVHTKSFNHTINTQVGKAIKSDTHYTEYHVYAMEWFEDHIDIFMDGNKYFSFKNSRKGMEEWPFDQDFHLLLNIAVGGNWGGKQGIDDQIFPATMKVDYVRVYQK
ncbi:glycosyl hydrolase family protein [Pedobacter polaris]|uniref:Glycosyl hydrolase family protein n=1 Tax=Pedobacter polaris TaxID=2571273 RepID=A0A4U1CYD0_9SPHI|nr:family 16 glycosylhydrolase [Pedobacter polaris]TKC12639.1 glycosyl hydrolase family protein [Pedobacter polaris]